jgi:hypothetical protein
MLTFINYLFHFNNIIQEINKEIAPDRKIKVKINALSKGSFVVDIELQSIILEFVKNFVFTPDGRSDLATIIELLSVMYGLKRFLSGKKPAKIESSGDKVIVTAENGNTIIVNYNVYNIYTNNPVISEAMEKQFETLENDENIDNVAILDEKEQEIIKVDRRDFYAMSAPNEIVQNQIESDTEVSAVLNIIRLSFDAKLKSDFFYKGHKITSYIRDTTFYDKIDKGESFSKGDTLEVDLKILKQYDESVDTKVIKGYEVSRVINHIPRNGKSQLQIDLT